MKNEKKKWKRKQCLIAYANKDTDKMTEMNEMFDKVLRNKPGAYLPFCI